MLKAHRRGGRQRRAASGIRAGGAILLFISLFQAISAVPASAQARVSAQPVLGPAGYVYKSVRSVFEGRWDRIVRQTRDISCAAASLATLRTYYFGQRTGEEDSLRDLLVQTIQNCTAEQARRSGFSMLDMKNYMESKGFEARGYAADPRVLRNLPIPVIVLVEIRGFPHYVVLKGVRQGLVYLADPLFGNISMKLATFARAWEGVLLAAIRAGKPLPVFNPLSVTKEDRLAIAEDEVDRVGNRRLLRFGALRLPNVLHLSILPVEPVAGISSVVPAFLTNHVDFKGWGG